MLRREPPKIADIGALTPQMQERVRRVIEKMRQRGFDPVLFESKRTLERQRWLYGVGRTHMRWRKPVTWTLKSKHLEGRAADIISRSRGWNWPEFYAALRAEARAAGLRTLRVEGCHVEL